MWGGHHVDESIAHVAFILHKRSTDVGFLRTHCRGGGGGGWFARRGVDLPWNQSADRRNHRFPGDFRRWRPAASWMCTWWAHECAAMSGMGIWGRVRAGKKKGGGGGWLAALLVRDVLDHQRGPGVFAADDLLQVEMVLPLAVQLARAVLHPPAAPAVRQALEAAV